MHFSAFVDLATEISAILPLWRLKLSVYFHLGEYYWKDFSSPASRAVKTQERWLGTHRCTGPFPSTGQAPQGWPPSVQAGKTQPEVCRIPCMQRFHGCAGRWRCLLGCLMLPQFCAALLASDGQLVSVVAMPLSEWNVRKWPSRAGSGCGSGSQYRSLKTSERGFLQTPDGHGVCPQFRTYMQFKSKSAKAEQHHTLTKQASSVKAMSLSECHHAQHQHGDKQSRTETHHGSSYITKKQPCSNNPPEMHTGGLCSEFPWTRSMPPSHRDLLQLASRDQHLATLMSRQNEEHYHLQDQARVAVGKNEMHQTTGSINGTACMLQIISQI